MLILFIWSRKTKREKRKKRLNWVLIGSLFFFSNTVIFSELLRMWEPEGKKIEEVGHYDVGIVLGGMAEYDNNLDRLSLRRGGDRLWQAMHLYHLGKVDKLLISGNNGHIMDKGLNEAVQFRDILIDFGIPAEDILVDSLSKNTHQNAVESKKVLDQFPELKNCLLITSALHMPRSEACFRKVGFENIDTFTTDHFTGEKRGYSFEQYIVPNISNLVDWGKFNHEWVGYLVYWVVGYV
jgi:uncharacterized SAM-binding protein YcdF (DUF218 family)